MDDLAHLLVPHDGVCWWCQARPATTGEHKYKRSDLSRLMGDDQALFWGDGDQLREIRGRSGITRDRYGVVKFPKSMCDRCNNARSQPFDLAYDRYAEYVSSHWLRIAAGLDFEEIYGEPWSRDLLNLARYFAKHFGCRMVRSGLRIPDSLRDFLDGASDMPDTQMVLITTDSVHKQYGRGLYISQDMVHTTRDRDRITGYVMAVYLGAIGVRLAWNEHPIPDGNRSQFFHYPRPILNYFRDEDAMFFGKTRRPGWWARFTQWLNQPGAEANP